MKRYICILLLIFLLFGSTDVFAWGQKGHAIVAYIAEKHLTRKARKAVDEILEGKSMVYYACGWTIFRTLRIGRVVTTALRLGIIIMLTKDILRRQCRVILRVMC